MMEGGIVRGFHGVAWWRGCRVCKVLSGEVVEFGGSRLRTVQSRDGAELGGCIVGTVHSWKGA